MKTRLLAATAVICSHIRFKGNLDFFIIDYLDFANKKMKQE